MTTYDLGITNLHPLHLPSLVPAITRDTAASISTRKGKRDFISSYNNIRIISSTIAETMTGGPVFGFYVEASPFVVDGPNGLRMNGFCADLLKLENIEGTGLCGTYFIYRDINVEISDEAATRDGEEVVSK